MARPPRRTPFAAVLAAALTVLLPSVALAGTPSDTADDTYMVSGLVNDIVIDGGNAWIGGKFSDVEDEDGKDVASANGLTVFNSSGVLRSRIHSEIPNLSGANTKIYDLSLGPDGILYVAGKFTYAKNGKSYKNLVGIDPDTGRIAATYRGPTFKSVLATSDGVFAGGRILRKYDLGGGGRDKSFHQSRVYIDKSLRGHKTAPGFREIVQISSSTLLVAGAFDWIDETNSSHQKKVAVMVNANNGQPDLGSGSWEIDCQCARQSSAAFGLAVDVAGGIAYVAAGGNDWVGAFEVSDGDRVWQTDTNGSAQELEVYDGSTLIVGGHWTYIEDDGPNDQSGAECPSRNASNPSPCWDQPRLAALDRDDGMPIKSWTPNVCCKYRGIWATTVQGSTLHVGGEFTKLDHTSGPERYYGRFG